MIAQPANPVIELLVAVAVNLMAFLSFLLVLLVGTRLEQRWVDRRRARIQAELRAAGYSAARLATVESEVSTVATHGSPLRVGFGLLAVAALGYLSVQSTNRTLLAVSYAGAAVLFVVYVAVEGYRCWRAYHIRTRLISDATEVR